MSQTSHDVVVIGAGIAGLSLARELRERGRVPLVLERARGIGGRCATRRLDGQPIDHGLAFLHGRSLRFLDDLAHAGQAGAIAAWPRVREGNGVPCQPAAFDPSDTRLALCAGVSGFAKHLASGLEVRVESAVETLTLVGERGPDGGSVWELTLASGETLRTKTVALTMPAPSALALLRRMAPPAAELGPLLPLLELVRVVPCLTVIARYPAATPVPSWDASYPRDSAAIQTILNDSSKRSGDSRLVLVVQARPRFSQVHLEEPAESWTRALLAEGAVQHGDWVLAPDLVQSHIWRHARVAAGSELARPLAVRLGGGTVLGIAGDGFHAAGGAEGAYLSGIALAARLLEPAPAGTHTH